MLDSETGHFLPDHHYLIRHTLSDQAGGGMQAMLRRASAFADYYGMPVDLLTYGFQPELTYFEASLRESGRLAPEVRVQNLWNILSEITREPSAELFQEWHGGKPLGQPSGSSEPNGVMDSGLQRMTQCCGDSEEIESIDYRREDGTRFVSDIRMEEGSALRRKVALLAPDQHILKSWNNVTDMFAWLLTKGLGRENSVIVVDHPAMANSIARNGYIAPNSVLIKCYHSNHSAAQSDVGFGVLSKRHMVSMERADVFDANVFPSSGQIDAVADLIGESSNLWSIGNIIEPAVGASSEEEHRKDTGVVISRLVREKNVDHAIDAVLMANSERSANEAPTMLSIFGTGTDQSRLEGLIDEHDVGDQIKLLGYTNDVYDEFKQASFSILPTNQEAFGLSIVESMACGCIPIVYDVPYGPGEIITDRVDGFLVPFGDIRAIADCVRTLRTMSDLDLEKMRDAARNRASDYGSREIAQAWARVIDVTRNRKDSTAKSAIAQRELQIASITPLDGPNGPSAATPSLDVELCVDSRIKSADLPGVKVFLSFRGRGSTLRIRVPGFLRIRRHGFLRRQQTLVMKFPIPTSQLNRAPREIMDTFVRINDGVTVREFRLKAAGVDLAAFKLPAVLDAYETKGGYLSLRKPIRRDF
ncbi:glycosyltransferase [Brevibacterium sp. UCMA 11752]|uniref:glycosyltransferase n=1 Tax=Brevibacterium sp. UCMA 11752 TaxID=2745946 RepID=UPI001F271EC9|nr:glycosyltransferase [Brevibacterium sp. UCMA 11752]MCF2587214.1 glycosyltransferase [Brevibacterium sp. UCMA 11752]